MLFDNTPIQSNYRSNTIYIKIEHNIDLHVPRLMNNVDDFLATIASILPNIYQYMLIKDLNMFDLERADGLSSSMCTFLP